MYLTDIEARDIIEDDVKKKMLGPGYAIDVLFCEDVNEEIIPEQPRNAYRMGMLLPLQTPGNTTANTDEDNQNDGDIFDVIEAQEAENEAVNNANNEGDLDWENVSDEGSEDVQATFVPQNQTANNMQSHIGLITCVNQNTNNVRITISYGTYSRMDWDTERNEVKVKSGQFTDSVIDAIEDIDRDENVRTWLQLNGIDSFANAINIDRDNNQISISPNLQNRPERNLYFRNGINLVVQELIGILFAPHFKRSHHETIREIALTPGMDINIEENLDENVRLYVQSFQSQEKKFIKVQLQSINQIIYQPKIELEGDLIPYTEPITSLEHDEENNINEFLYRNVENYGKGVNCAIGWDNNRPCNRVFTTFIPTVNIEKFSNKANDQEIIELCKLRNLSIWTERDNEEYIECLSRFVKGYETWHKEQTQIANNIEGYDDQKTTILGRQEILLDRLSDNVQYLQNNEEALNCFKIANTAMLLQMVVARHPDFSKGRPLGERVAEFYNNLEFFSNATYTERMDEPSYYPFQLAFLLMNVKSTFEVQDVNHTENVDLIWFPTGGGKTEAYLALTALTIVQRRRVQKRDGVSVIMRYTLRLLTTQQFERATYLICALDFLRQTNQDLNLGEDEISIGLYVGNGVTPNTITDARTRYRGFFANPNGNNPFPVCYCPWCGTNLVDETRYGYDQEQFTISCLNNKCIFSGQLQLPIYYIDEQIYQRKPTLLFATVDKFAQLYRNENANLLRDCSPDLIIQDELHLLVGALGSITGFYEPMIEKLCSTEDRRPKIIASTATTRNTSRLIQALYNRNVNVFPAQGIEYNDNYFSHTDRGNEKRRQIGLAPSQNVSSNVAEIRLTAILLLAKVKVFKEFISRQGLDWTNPQDVIQACKNDDRLAELLTNYWTTVLYYNNLKDLGRSRSRVPQEIFENVRSHQYLYLIPNSLRILRCNNGFTSNVIEFTSRIDSGRIKGYLDRAQNPIGATVNGDHLDVNNNRSDLVFASNMISVGIDIGRWNLMIMVGQPKSVSEYVQASSRVARNTYGLVLNLFNPHRVRELSIYENYTSFHNSYYKAVEPLSITPFTRSTIKHKILNNIIEIYRRYFLDNLNIDETVFAQSVYEFLFKNRFENAEILGDDFIREAKNAFMHINEDNKAQALRSVGENSYISINGVTYSR